MFVYIIFFYLKCISIGLPLSPACPATSLRGFSGLTRCFRRVISDFFLQRTHKLYYYLIYCYMFIDVSTIFTNFVNKKKLKSNAVDCFKVMVKKKKTWSHGAHDWARSSDQKQKLKRDYLSVCLWLSFLPELW